MTKKQLYAIILIALTITGCTDPYKLQTNTFDEALVVEATITNEFKKQEIKLSKTYRLEEDGPATVSGANVTVSDDAGNSYEFTEFEGVYLSDVEFQAVADRDYTLSITTSDGKSYSSATERLTTVSPLTNVTATAETAQSGKGIQIRVSSVDPTGTAKYYRYRFDETYKVIAPKWVGVYAMVVNDSDPDYSSDDVIVVLPRTYEAQTCYSNQSSDKIILVNTTTLSEDRVDNFPVRFISASDDIITHRYSINVIQYVQNLASYTFYKTLAQMAGTGGSILSQNQPGFFSGNLYSDNDPDEKVIGFFEVSSVSQQRIFFNHDDVLPNEPEPPFSIDCNIFTFNASDFSRDSNQGGVLRSNIDAGALLYYSNEGDSYEVVPKECGDCTTFSSNVVPPFWID